jgi:hypothetical protein
MESNFSDQLRSKSEQIKNAVSGVIGDESQSRREGPIASAIEKQTARLPSDTFLWAAAGSIATSLVLEMTGRRQPALFVGQWAPTFLLLGIYNKIVKVAGSQRDENDSFGNEGPNSPQLH